MSRSPLAVRRRTDKRRSDCLNGGHGLIPGNARDRATTIVTARGDCARHRFQDDGPLALLPWEYRLQRPGVCDHVSYSVVGFVAGGKYYDGRVAVSRSKGTMSSIG